MSRQYERLQKCYEYYRSVTDFIPRVGLILGSGHFLFLPSRGTTVDSCWDISGMSRLWS